MSTKTKFQGQNSPSKYQGRISMFHELDRSFQVCLINCAAFSILRSCIKTCINRVRLRAKTTTQRIQNIKYDEKVLILQHTLAKKKETFSTKRQIYKNIVEIVGEGKTKYIQKFHNNYRVNKMNNSLDEQHTIATNNDQKN